MQIPSLSRKTRIAELSVTRFEVTAEEKLRITIVAFVVYNIFII